MSTANLYHVPPASPTVQGPVYTPAEYNQDPYVEERGSPDLEDRIRQTHIQCRPSRRPVVFFLQPVDWYERQSFVPGLNNVLIHREDGVPKGRWMPQDYRRNIAVPPSESYGDAVGEMDGYAPYGLD